MANKNRDGKTMSSKKSEIEERGEEIKEQVKELRSMLQSIIDELNNRHLGQH